MPAGRRAQLQRAEAGGAELERTLEQLRARLTKSAVARAGAVGGE